ncbi:MAG: YqaA family protein [Actinomycetota bacterium]|nr:DedA family protein [Actinomycetota bacterium]
MRSRLFHPIQRLVQSDSGLILAFFWGVAEALFFPIFPDYYLFAVVPAAPSRWWRAASFATVGSIIGGTIGYWIAVALHSFSIASHMPLIAPGMMREASDWIRALGGFAVLRQPLSGIPYKVFVFLCGARHLSFIVFIWASLIARGVRLFAIAGLAAILGKLPETWRSRTYDLFLALFTITFGLALAAVVRSFR